MNEFETESYRLAFVKQKIERLNKRARKLGLPEITMSIISRRTAIVRVAIQDPETGEVGKRCTWRAQVEGRHSYERRDCDGSGLLIKMRADDGADLLWFCGGNASEFETGSVLWIRGTVRRHETDRRTGLPVTILARVAVSEEPKPKAPRKRARKAAPAPEPKVCQDCGAPEVDHLTSAGLRVSCALVSPGLAVT